MGHMYLPNIWSLSFLLSYCGLWLCKCKCFPLSQMCEQAAEAHKSKGSIHSSRRSSRTSSDPGQFRRSSVDAILANSSSVASPQVCILLSLNCCIIRFLFSWWLVLKFCFILFAPWDICIISNLFTSYTSRYQV